MFSLMSLSLRPGLPGDGLHPPNSHTYLVPEPVLLNPLLTCIHAPQGQPQVREPGPGGASDSLPSPARVSLISRLFHSAPAAALCAPRFRPIPGGAR